MSELGPYHTFDLLSHEQLKDLKSQSQEGYMGYLAFAASEARRLKDDRDRIEVERKQLREDAKLDLFTKDLNLGILNKVAMDTELELLAGQVSRFSERETDPNAVVLIYFDADKFKTRINSRFGQDEGDNAIKELAFAHAHAVRYPGDLISRDGGDEFLAAIPVRETSDRRAEYVAQIVIERDKQNCEILNTARRESGGRDYILTNTYGVAVWRPGGGKSILEAKKTANKAMMRNKQKGDSR